jgi:hypothetical protein
MTWADLEKIIPAEQLNQMADLFGERYADGYGVIEIHFADHQISLFYTGRSVKPVRVRPGCLSGSSASAPPR